MGTQSEQLLYVIEINYEIVSSEPNHSAVISVHDLHKGRTALWPCFPTEDLMYLGNPDGICEDISMFAGAEYANAHFTANSSKVGCSGSSLGDAQYFHWRLEAPPQCFVFLMLSICWRRERLLQRIKKKKAARLFVADLRAVAI